MRRILWALTCSAALLAMSAPAPAQDRGLALTADALGGARWQSRFEHDAWPRPGQERSLWLPVEPTQTLRLLGDYPFNRLRLGDSGGLRLTGGLLVNLRPAAVPALLAIDDSRALPYAGIGWAGGSPLGNWGTWGISADLGMAAQGLGSLRLDRLFNGGSGLSVDGAPRLLPMVRLGMHLAF